MKKHLPALLIIPSFLMSFFLFKKLIRKKVWCNKLKLTVSLSLMSLSLFAQSPTHTLNSSGSLSVPAGVAEMTVEAWGGGGAGGGASGSVANGRAGAGGAVVPMRKAKLLLCLLKQL